MRLESRSTKRDRTWIYFLMAGLAAFTAYFALLKTENQHNLMETLINLVCVGAMVVGIRRNKPSNRLGWYFIAAGFLLFGLGNVPTTYYVWTKGSTQPFPSIADAGYLLTEPLICVGLLLFIRSRRGDRHGGKVLDTAIFAVGLGYPIYAFLVEPHLDDRTVPLFSRLVSSAYPLADLTLIAVALAFVLGPGRRSTAYRFMLTAFVALLASDLAFSGAILAGYFSASSIINVGWPLFSIFGATAALHPSMFTIDQPSESAPRLTTRRVVLLSAAVLLAPLVHLLQDARHEAEPYELIAISLTLFALTARRLYGFMKEDRAQRQALSDTVSELRISEEQRGELLRRTVEIGEQERSLLAAELHDGPIQRLSALALNLEQVKRFHARGESDRGMLERTQLSLSLEIRKLRLMMGQLRPPALDERGLASALTDHAMEVCREAGLVLREDVNFNERISEELETVLFRVAQEALRNVVRHARASEVILRLWADDGAVRLSLADDGVGFDSASNGDGSSLEHFGLVAMRERVELSGGSWIMQSAPGAGTKIEATIPVAQRDVA